MRTLIPLAITLVASSAIAQNYEIVDTTGAVRATATIQRNQLMIVESTGERAVFHREPRYDTADRQLLGFYSANLQRVFRFPARGSGAMQVADLDQPNPAFRQTQRRVRPAETDFGNPVTPGFAGRVATGYAAGGYGSFPHIAAYRAPLPRSVLIESKIVANPLLEDAKVRLTNSGPRELLVQVRDLKTRQSQQLNIQPGSSKEIQLHRDPGGKRVARYQTTNLAGDTAVQEVVSDIRPTIRYEIIVREWVMQSIAIDRTGTSPSVIEDVNFQGKGLGRFTLPAGKYLRSGTLDVYRAAASVANAGAISTIPAQEKVIGDGLSPLERAVRDLQRRR